MEMLRKAGVRMFHKVGSVRHALHAQEAGYDGVYAAGIEEGGHPLNDDVTTMVLTPRVVESVSIPVVTVGGIADGRSLAAALMLGAEGVMMATRFMATKECQVHDNIKQEIVRRQEQDTTLICKSIHLQAGPSGTGTWRISWRSRNGAAASRRSCRSSWESGSARPGIRAMWTSPP